MEFLVRIEVDLPPELPDANKEELLEAERRRGRELIESGRLVRIWRLPGRLANVSLYDVADATELDAALRSLPLHPWMRIQVDALAVHPLEA